MRRRRSRFPIFAALFALCASCGGEVPGDRAEWHADAETPPRIDVERRSFYLPMRDGVKIAIDVLLPDGAGDGSELPTILVQTRYWRSARLRWPFGAFLDRPDDQAQAFLDHGYAWVSVDARGSGASFGTRPHPWSEDETLDGAEVVDWIVAQPWSSGKVGALGISYDGTTAEFLLANDHPAVVAAAPRFALFDVYTDIAFPGGIQLTWFSEKWGEFNRSLDRDAVPPFMAKIVGWPASLLIAGVRPVDDDADGALLAEAVRGHADNWDVHASAQGVTFRDDPNAAGVTQEAFSPHRFADRLDASGAAIYSYSGWYDGGYARAAIRRHLLLRNRENRLILGPWNHGGDHQVRGGHSEPTNFDHEAELLAFFDHHLRGRDTGIAARPRVQYFTMVEERWKGADRWPPPAEKHRLYLAADGALLPDKPRVKDAADTYEVDLAHGTGDASRWNSLMGLPVEYPDRAGADARLLSYTTPPLDQPVEVTGHPKVALYLASSATDASLFVYLEDVAPDGRVTLVTEGQLRALHRARTEPHPRTYLDAVVVPRSFERADGRPLEPGEAAHFVFDLLPTSYFFERGHAIRIALAGADRDHFPAIPPGESPTWQVYRDRQHPSSVDLPVIPRESQTNANAAAAPVATAPPD